MAPLILSLRLAVTAIVLCGALGCRPGEPAGNAGGPISSPPGSPPPTATTALPIPTIGPVTPAPDGGTAPAAITVARPVAGEEVRTPLRVQGSASVFEANVRVVVRNGRGEVVGEGFTTATAGAPARGDYVASIPFALAGGRQSGVVEVFSPSPRDGTPQSSVSVPVVLVPN